MKESKLTDSMPLQDQPYERFKSEGAESLSEAELLAIIIRSGTAGSSALTLAQRILKLTPDQEGITGLCRLSIKDLKSVKGVGEIKAIQLKCLGEISKRIAKATAKKRLCINKPETIADYYKETLRHLPYECVYVMMLNSKNFLIKDECISKGTVNASFLSPREIYIKALEAGAVKIVLIHNHPSGDVSPSLEDINITKRIITAGEIIGIELVDHIIIGDSKYHSIMEHGLNVL